MDGITRLTSENRQYGSGYPGVTGRGVAGRDFPFIFWPLAWGGAVGYGANAYLHSDEVASTGYSIDYSQHTHILFAYIAVR